MSKDDTSKVTAQADKSAAGDDAASWGSPAFAKDFPRHRELDELVAAFARGDYATIRERAPKLAASTEEDAVKRAAQMLRERIDPDPTSRYLFLFAAALLAFLTIWWVAHDGPPDQQQSGPRSSSSAKSAPKPVPTIEHID